MEEHLNTYVSTTEGTVEGTTERSTSNKSITSFNNNVNKVNEQESDLTVSPVKIATVISKLFRNLILENINKDIVDKDDIFYAKKVPAMSLEEYLTRIIKYSQLDSSSIILAVIYIDKFCNERKYVLSFNNIHRILLSSILVAIKYNEDDFYKNSQYAKIGGINLIEMNLLEYELCSLLDFSLYIDSIKFNKYEEHFNQLL